MIRNISECDDDDRVTGSPIPCRPAVPAGAAATSGGRPHISVLGDVTDVSEKAAWQLAHKNLLADRPDPLCDDESSSNSAAGIYSCNGLRAIFLCICLMTTLVVQGSFLNYWLIDFNEGRSEWYFLFFADFVILVTFGFSITFAWRYYQRLRKEHLFHDARHHSQHHDPHDAQVRHTKRVGAGLFRFSFPKPMGMLPLIYVCWIMYAVTLVVKLYMLYLLNIPQHMVVSGFKSPKEYILITLAASVAVFFFWVEAHWLIGDDVHKRLSKPSVDDLIGHTMFEIFDSLDFLDLITPDDHREVSINQIAVTASMKIIILLLASVNFLIPFLGLYRLSRTHFGEKTNGMIRVVDELTGRPTTRGLGISIVYHCVRLFVVNIPFLIIRFYMSSEPTKELSVFVVKNALGILVSIRNLIPEMQQWVRVYRFKKNVIKSREAGRAAARQRQRHIEANDSSVVAGGDQSGWELPTVFTSHSSGSSNNSDKRRAAAMAAGHRTMTVDSDDMDDGAQQVTDTTRTSSSSTNNASNELNGQHKI